MLWYDTAIRHLSASGGYRIVLFLRRYMKSGMRKVTKETFKIFWRYGKRYRLTLAIMLISLGTVTVIESIIPFFYKRFFDVLAVSHPHGPAAGRLVRIVAEIFGLWMLTWLGYRIEIFCNGFFQPRVMADLEDACFEYLHRHSYSFFVNRFAGSLVRRVNRFVDAFESVADRMYLDLFPMILRSLLTLVVLWVWHSLLGILVAAWLVAFFAANYVVANYKLKYDLQAAAVDTEVTGQLADTVTNNINIKLFSSLARELARYREITERHFRIRRFTWRLSGAIEGMQALFMVSLEFGVFYVAVRLWDQGLLTLGDFVLIQAYLVGMFRRLWETWRVIRDIYRRLADAEEMTEILTTPHEVADRPDAGELEVRAGEVEFRNVTFAYHKTREVVQDFSLRIRPGQKVGLVGPSGAGKSTLVSLLFRFFDVAGGGIFIDGVNIAAVTQDSLRAAVALVPQDPILFHRTLLENIRYGRHDATDEEVFVAARLAHCDEFIERLAQGYRTYVGERGIKLSGGERQRVAIARAILKNAPILVLDEATSSLDSHSEGLIQEALARLMEGKTTIVIAHRLSTIMKMDRIVVVRRGAIVEAGSHQELVQKSGGLYKKLWELQAGGFLSS
ncbi:MAG: ABC transporter ATP-binding protein [Candidatus Sungbacteria bacterium]|uniref:ABC transporter ATP-binding protein n=1 Tax=Candidatus Sungiibacteriota bacterium TaxID=2750080 RepID=A0A932R0V6_9BACT|nr:ABC transporter ATP-binding protein [Candidatus Sungbacteria bacterium]